MSLEMINFEIFFLLILRAWLLPNTRLHYISSYIITFSYGLYFYFYFLCQYYPFIIYSTVIVFYIYIFYYMSFHYTNNISINYSIYSIYFKSTIYWLGTICTLGLLKEKPASRRAACATSELGFSFSVTSMNRAYTCFYSYTVVQYIMLNDIIYK